MWFGAAGQKLVLAYDHAGGFLHFGAERESLNLLNSTDLFIYLFCWSQTTCLSPEARCQIWNWIWGGGEEGASGPGGIPKPWPRPPAAGSGSLRDKALFSHPLLLPKRVASGELVLMIWSRPGGGECLPLGERSGEAGGLCWCSFSPFERRGKAAVAGLWLCPCFSRNGPLPCCFLTSSYPLLCECGNNPLSGE